MDVPIVFGDDEAKLAAARGVINHAISGLLRVGVGEVAIIRACGEAIASLVGHCVPAAEDASVLLDLAFTAIREGEALHRAGSCGQSEATGEVLH